MKSFKKKIRKKGRRIAANKISTKDIGNIINSIDKGEIPISQGDDKVTLALELAKQNSKNLESGEGKKYPTVVKGDYDTLERIDNKKLGSIASRTLSRKFGHENDYIELHIYNLKGQLLESINEFTDYSTPTNTADSYGKTDNFTINPVDVLNDLNYSSGQYKIILNIQKRQILNGFSKIFSIKEISPSRQEIKASYSEDTRIKTQLDIFVGRMEDSPFFKDFVLNFGQNRNELAINLAINNNRPEILIKLFEPLDDDLSVGDQFRIATEITDPVSMDVDLGEPIELDTSIQLQGPNYKIDTRLLNSVPSQYKTFDNALEYSLTSSYQHLLQQLEYNEVPNIQYDYIRRVTDTGSLDVAYHFENFVHFGNATERLKNFKYKLSLIELYDSQIASINTITGDTSASAAVIENKTTINDKKTNLVKGFDGYERYLYFESGAYSWPKSNNVPPYNLFHTTSSQGKEWLGSDIDNSPDYGGQLLSASLFDRQNPHTLLNLIPRHIADNPENNQYTLFTNMIGQHFDQIWTYIHHITKQKDTHHTDGVSKHLVYTALKSLGVETFDQFENANLIEYILGEGSQGNPFYDTPVSQSLITASNAGSIAKQDITKEIWKRLYHNAPYLLKTKGTERGIHALMNCYGIPSTILNIKEYGGPVKDKSGYKTFSYDKYSNSLSGDSGTSGWFIKSPYSGSAVMNLSASARTVEFRMKPYRHPDDVNYHLLTISGSTSTVSFHPHLTLQPYTGSDISSSGDANQYGRINFIYQNLIKSSTPYFPVYNGEFWNVFIGTTGISASADTLEFGAYQSNYLKNTSFYRSSFSYPNQTHRGTQWGDHNQGLPIPKTIYLGGQGNNPSGFYGLVNDLRYSGSMQEFRCYFGELLSHETLVKHALEPFMYAGNTISSSFENLVLRLPLGSNNILGISSGSYHPNQHINFIQSESISSNMSFQEYKPHVEKHHLVTPDTVGSSMSSEKVRIDEGTIDDDILSIIVKSETSTLDRQPQDYEDLGIFFSPQHEINEDIIYTLGGFRLDDYIGSPLKSAQSASSYGDLNTIKNHYFKKYKNHQKYNIWDYTKLIQYIDHTLFKIIEQHVPAKANLKTGLLIEPHYLERNKFALQVPTTDEFTTMLTDSHQTFFVNYDRLTSASGFWGQITCSIDISSHGGVILDEPQFGAQAPIKPAPTTGLPFRYKPFQSSVLLGNARKGRPSSIYFRSLQLGKETDY